VAIGFFNGPTHAMRIVEVFTPRIHS